METLAYAKRRDEIRTYFDRTALDAWKRFATEAPLGRIRETVRQGRAQMRAAILGMLPQHLPGWRILDAGCGAGMLSVELARRGARVVAVDVAPEIVRFAAQSLPADIGADRIDFRAGDMLGEQLGRFDAVVAMDSLIHYEPAQAADAAAALARRTERCMVLTFAPQTPLLAAMHTAGRLFPRGDRAPSIRPVSPARMTALLGEACGETWKVGRTARVGRGFYTSQAVEVLRS